MKIANIEIPNGLFLAPLAGVSDRPFRLLARRYGAEYTTSEMVSAKALCYEQRSKRPVTETRVRTAPLAAVMADRYENVLLFLRREDKNVNQTLSDGATALHLTAETMSPVMAELLLTHGAKKNLRNRAGDTPLEHLRKEMKRQGIDESHPDAAKLLTLLQ